VLQPYFLCLLQPWFNRLLSAANRNPPSATSQSLLVKCNPLFNNAIATNRPHSRSQVEKKLETRKKKIKKILKKLKKMLVVTLFNFIRKKPFLNF